MRRELVLLGLVIAFVVTAFPGEGKEVLWDIHHGLCGEGCDPNQRFLHLFEILEEEGIFIRLSDLGVLNEDLSQFDGLIITSGTAFNEPYTEAEASVIESFAINGGGLLILGDICARPVHINPVAQRFGVIADPDNSIIPDMLHPIIQHPIFEGVEKIELSCASQLIVEPPSISAASNSEGEVGVAVAEVQQGRVVVTGDASIFQDCCFFGPFQFPRCCEDPELDNETFARNLFRWLLKLDCSSFDDLDESIAEAEIDNDGIRNSLQSKVNNARRQYEGGNLRVSGNILCAFLHEVDGQEGRHIDPTSAQALRDCVWSMAEALEIPLPCFARRENAVHFIEISPNPFSASGEPALIHYTLPASPPPRPWVGRGDRARQADQRSAISDPIRVRLAIYDLTGRLVRTLVDGFASSGPITNHQSPITVSWDGTDEKGSWVPSGVYFYRLESGKTIATKKFIVLR